MKILFLFPHFISPGGAANVVLKFAIGLKAKGHTVEILCSNATPEFIKNNAALKITQLHIPNSSSLIYWLLFPYWQYRINKTLAKYSNYILFPHVLPSNWWAWIYKRYYKTTKVVWYCHEPSAFIHSKTWINAIPNPIMKLGAKICNPLLKYFDISLEKNNDFVICNSTFTKTEYERCYKKIADKIIYPPIQIEENTIELKKESYFFSVSRLSKFKKLDLLINAFSEIVKTYPNYKLIISGDGEEKKNLQNLTAKLGIEKHVQFTGNVTDDMLTKLYKKARATIQCSTNEPFGLVPVESMMYGTPVIAHNSGGPKETIVHNETGFLFNNKKELATYLEKIISLDETQYQTMQDKCLNLVKKYDLAQTIANLEKVFYKTQ